MIKPKVLVTRRWPAPAEQALADHFETTLNVDDHPLTREELARALQQYDALLPTVSDRITAETLQVEPLRTRILASFGAGYNHIDLEAAQARGITVTNTPDVLTDATADLAITLLLMAARRAGEGERQLRAGQWTGWRPTHMMGTHVSGKSIGIVGMGRIGQAVARRAHHGFGMTVVFFNRSPVDPGFPTRQCSTLEEVLRTADFISLHLPSNQETRHLINAERIATMKTEAILINTARGDIVDEAALVEALAQGTIAGAGLDVYEREPSISPGLLALENVVLLPHLGSATIEAREAMGMRVIANLQAFFQGEEPPDRVG
ncbi:MAG: D-glycerate dehydrogenase [Acidimicrobiia bacterium]|nr:D-glycerate dehydrogenase [Acidimicrobiia bacterium]